MAINFMHTNYGDIVIVENDNLVTTSPVDPTAGYWADYEEWLKENPYVPPAPPTPLTAAEKLEAAGLTVDELKELLGL